MRQPDFGKWIVFSAVLALAIGFGLSIMASAQDANVNPLFTEKKVKNYLPHMTWLEVEEALKRTDVVIIPVGSIEQHAKHLPLGTDSYGAIEICKLIAQKAEVLVAPTVLAGLSSHHMGFPGTITLTPKTFEAVIYETALSLIEHGFHKILIYNGHGGNAVSVANVIQKINQTTPATALDLEKVQPPRKEPLYPPIPYDVHSGVSETSGALYLMGSLVDMSKAENPVLTFPPNMLKFIEMSKADPIFGEVADKMGFRPLETGKKTSTREVTNTGAVTTGDIKTATAERGRKELEDFVAAAAKFIEEWRNK
jgi:creatinine amidohydrolase